MPRKIFKSSQSQDLITADLSAGRVKLTWAKQSEGQIVIEDVRSKEVAEGADLEITQFLIQTWRDWRLKDRQAVCIIPSKLFISKNVDMPSNDPEEISKIIDLQAGRYTPYSRDEIVIDYLCMTTPGQHYTNVLLIIVNRKLIDRYVQIFDKAGVLITKFGISSEAAAHFYERLLPSEQLNGSVAGLHIDQDNSDLVIIDKREMVFVRSLPVGASQFRSDPQSAEMSLAAEFKKSLASFQDHGVGQPVKALVMTGLVPSSPSLEKSIRDSFPAGSADNFPVKSVSYAAQFQCSSALKTKLGTENTESFFELMAASGFDSELKIDLTPKEIKLKRKFRESGREIITLGILIMTCLVMICVFLAGKIYIKRNLIERLDVKAESLSSQARTLEKASTKIRVLRNSIGYRGKGLYVFDKVVSLFGPDSYLSSFSYDPEGNIILLGTSETMSGVFALVTKFESSGLFSSVTTQETKTRKEGGKEVADFDLKCQLNQEI